MAKRYPAFKQFVDDGIGTPASGWLIYTYETDGVTPKATYKNSQETVTHANPIVLDSRGEAEIYWDGLYRVEVRNAADVIQYSIPNYGEEVTSSTTNDGSLIRNGSFENSSSGDGLPDDWTVALLTGGTFLLDPTINDHGSLSAKFTSGGVGGGTLTSTYFEVSSLEPLSWTGEILSSLAGNLINISVEMYDSALVSVGTTSLYNNSATNPTTNFVLKSGSFTPSATARWGRLILTAGDGTMALGESVWFENFRITPYVLSLISTSDTPSTYVGAASKHLRVNSGETAVEFVTIPPAFGASDIPGYLKLGKISYSSTTAITLEPSVVEVNDGSTSRLGYWDSTLTFTFGPAGSNSGSMAVGAKQWHYIYVYTAILPSSGIITAGTFYNATIAPVYDATKHGWYYGSSRCIAAFRTNASSQLEKFFDVGNGWIQPQGWQAGTGFDKFLTGGTATSYTLLSPDVPVGTTAIQINANNTNVAHQLFISNDGSVDDLYIEGRGTDSHVFITALNASRQIYYKMSLDLIDLYTSAYRTNY